jgi:HK97 family phage portal protein
MADAFTTGEPVATGGATLSSALEQSAWVYACVRTLSESVANVEFTVEMEEAKEKRHRAPAPSSPAPAASALFANPNPFTSRFDFWELLVAWLMLRGKAFVVATDRDGQVVRLGGRLKADPRPERLYVLPADRISRIPDGNWFSGWRYQPTVGDPLSNLILLPEELLFIRLPHPFNSWEGLAPLQAAALAASGDFAAAQFMRGLMLANAQVSPTFTSDQQLSDDQMKQVLAAVRERKRTAGTADRPLVLHSGLKPVPPEITVADMQFLENRKFSRQEICACFGVPQELIGFTEDANRSVGDAARLNFIENRIAPLCNRLANSFAPVLQCFGNGLVAEFCVEDLPVMQASRRTRIDGAVKLWGMGYPANVINEALDLGLPELPDGNTGYLPFSVSPVGADAPAAGGASSESPSNSPSPAPAEKSANPFTTLAALLRAGGASAASPNHSQPHTCGHSEAFAKAIAGSERKKRQLMSRFFFEQRKRALAALESGARSAEGLALSHRSLLDQPEEDARLIARLKPALVADLEFGGAQVWTELGSAADFALPPMEAVNFMARRQEAIKGINQETSDRLNATLQEGLLAGESQEKLADRVRSEFVYCDQVRAERIAATETGIAVNSGRFVGLQEAGVEKKAWLTSHLENTRTGHKAAERDYAAGIPLEDTFRVIGPDGTVDQMLHPGDPSASAGNVINCRCILLSVHDSSPGPDQTSAPRIPARFLAWESWLARANAPTTPSGLPFTPSEPPEGTIGASEADRQNAMACRRNAQGS